MKQYHFSVKFSGDNNRYHGDFYTHQTKEDEILKRAKKELSLKLPKWCKLPEQIVMFEIYYFDESGVEINVYKFRKEIEI